MDQTALIHQIKPTFLKLREVIDASADYFNRPPSYGGWTPGQAVRHIHMFLAGIPDLLVYPASEKREPANQKVQQIISIFLDMKSKFNAPESVMPEDKEFEPKRFAESFAYVEKKMDERAHTEDLSYVCSAFDIPGMGPFTRLEFLAFGLFHTQRHIAQIERMIVDFRASTF